MTIDPVTIHLASFEETIKFGKKLGLSSEPGLVITLDGPLGSGKTTLTQGIAQGLEVPETYFITSPTFSLLHEYPGRLPLYHMDLYRLSSEEEIEDLGFLDYIYGEGVTVIEWPDRLGTIMPRDRLQIELQFTSDLSRAAILETIGIPACGTLALSSHEHFVRDT